MPGTETERPQSQSTRTTACDATIITVAGALLSYLLLGSPAITGMDDANITQIYARNISNGFGYVYTPGYEIIEGSTSILWTSINVIVFLFSDNPEIILIFLNTLLSVGSIYFCLSILDTLNPGIRLSLQGRLAAGIVFIGMLGFYAWTILSLMETGLWTLLFIAMTAAILRRITGRADGRRSVAVIALLSVLLGLARPEAMILVPALLAIGVIGEWRLEPYRRDLIIVYGTGLLCSVLTTGIQVLFRIKYFGYPFPNSYYVKISSNIFDNIKSGIIYFASFSTHAAFGELLIIIAGITFAISVWRSYFSGYEGVVLRRHRAHFMITAVISVMLLYPLATGGDHFGSNRLYQTAVPLMWVILILFFAEIVYGNTGLGRLPQMPRRAAAFLAALIFLGSVASNFYRNNDIRNEFTLAVKGRAIGEYLNRGTAGLPGTRVAVTAAGGIARTYSGRVVDLMGLNWLKMAHATDRRTGVHGHSAFSDKVFWSEMPEFLLPSLHDRLPAIAPLSEFKMRILNDLPRSENFRRQYTPIAIPVSNVFIVGFAHRKWVKKLPHTTEHISVNWPN